MNIDITEAEAKDRPVLSNLGRLFTYDVSEYGHAASDYYFCQNTGLFNDGCESYYEKEACSFFLPRVDGELAGFAIVQKLPEDPGADYTIAEFFVTRPFRRQGVGKYMAHHLFDRFQGRWDVVVWVLNRAAFAFWDKVVVEYTSNQCQSTFEHPERYGPPYDQWRLCTHRFISRTPEI